MVNVTIYSSTMDPMRYWKCDPPHHPVSTTDSARRVLRRFQGILEVAVHQIRLRGPRNTRWPRHGGRAMVTQSQRFMGSTRFYHPSRFEKWDENC